MRICIQNNVLKSNSFFLSTCPWSRIAQRMCAAMALGATLVGCGGSDFPINEVTDGPLTASRQVAVSDADCAFGGTISQTGEDLNGNGILEDAEVSASETVCFESAQSGGVEPIINSLELSTPFIFEGDVATVVVTTTEIPGVTYSFAWSNSEGPLSGTANQIEVPFSQIGNGTITVRVTASNNVVQTRTINIDVRRINSVSTTNQQIFLPVGVLPLAVSGAIDGTLIFAGADETVTDISQLLDRDISGFVVQKGVSDPLATANETLGDLHRSVAGLEDVFTISVISESFDAQAGYALGEYLVRLSGDLTATELNNLLVLMLGRSTETGEITDLPISLPGELSTDVFRLSLAVSRESEAVNIVVATLIAEENFADYIERLSNITDGTNIGTPADTRASVTDTFVMPDVQTLAADFLFVIDNSGSMGDEQVAISDAGDAFIAEIAQSGLDFNLGVITTDDSELRGTGFTTDVDQFKLDIKPGISGSSIERGILMAEQALGSQLLGDAVDGTVTLAGHPRPNASLSVVIMSDEPSQHRNFDVENNLFLARNYTVYGILNARDAAFSQYDDLAFRTGGSVADIDDPTTFPEIMQKIANNAGGRTSPFVLSNPAIAGTLSVFVDGVEIPNGPDGWQYFSTSQTILFRGSAVPVTGSNIVVQYQHIVPQGAGEGA